ncbi:MAG: hypothetical protein A2Y78_10185 [Acidobacteria bacterium RBG_13_68_16]|nr:MAG: hypothetical protein A2Y78_10185 [Acidobacteria bacterium RBG_13_68_16]
MVDRVLAITSAVFAVISLAAWRRRTLPHRQACVCGHLHGDHHPDPAAPFSLPCAGTVAPWEQILMPDVAMPRIPCLCTRYLDKSKSRYRYPKG